MAVLVQCPRCSFAYLRPDTVASEPITCRRCLCVFDPAALEATKQAPEPLPLSAAEPIIVSTFVNEILIEPEPAREVLQESGVRSQGSDDENGDAQVAPPQAAPTEEMSPTAVLLGSLEIGERQAAAPDIAEVEPIAPPPLPPIQPARTPEPKPVEVVADAAVIDPVEVIDEPPAAVPAAPVARPAAPADLWDEPTPPPTVPPPMPRRPRERPRSIEKQIRRTNSPVPSGVWLGLALGLGAILLTVVLIVVVSRSGGGASAPAVPAPVAAEIKPPVADPPQHFLPAKDEWPPPPDRRGPAPWRPSSPPRGKPPGDPAALPGLIGYWSCDEGQGVRVADQAPGGLPATLVGAWWIDGVRGKALFFDGRRDYLELGSAPKLNFGPNAPFTLCLWMATQQHDGFVLAFRDPKDLAPVIQIKLNGGSLCGIVRADGQPHGEARVGLVPAADGRWHHVALVRHAGGAIECFLDARPLDKRVGSNTQGAITTTVRSIGCERTWFLSQRTSAAYCACAIDELSIFDRALSANEIAILAGK
jgi:hypothetical protein